MVIELDTLYSIDKDDVVDGVFVAPKEVLYIADYVNNPQNIIKSIFLPNVIEIGHGFFQYSTNDLEQVIMPEVKSIGDDFLVNSYEINKIHIPKIEKIGFYFLFNNLNLKEINMPEIKTIKNFFIPYNKSLKYTHQMIKAIDGDLYINGCVKDKVGYIRKLNIEIFKKHSNSLF